MVEFKNVQAQRIPYAGIRRGVRYVTDPAQLPKDEAFSGYDAEFFRSYALLLVTDTVGSGSVRVGIRDIRVQGNTATVFLSRNMTGTVGTADMATWHIWAEVEPGLDYRWMVAEPVRKPLGIRLESK